VVLWPSYVGGTTCEAHWHPGQGGAISAFLHLPFSFSQLTAPTTPYPLLLHSQTNLGKMEAGTAIGIASLGIQVCEGLLKYYHGVKGYENDIQETYKEMKSLSKTFALLKTSLQAVASQTLATRAQECLVECQDGIQQLDAKLSRLHKEAPAGLRQKAQAGALRMIYPLQKKPLEELKTIAQNMTRHLNLAIQVITLDSGQSIERTTDEIKTTVESTEALTTKLQVTTLDTQQQVSTTAANVETLLSTEQSKELARILRWLSAPDPSVNHMQARDKYEPGTGEWFFEREAYKDWVSGSSPLLWLHGKAGCCKTILCSTIIEHVSHEISGQHGVALAYFYFSFSDAQKQNYTNLLSSLVTDLSRGRVVNPLLRDIYQQNHPRSPSIDVLEKILLCLLRQATTAFLLVDALDECSEEQQSCTVQGLKGITKAVPTTRLLITSRKTPNIEDLMSCWCENILPVDEACVNKDIDLFVKNALACDRRLVRLPSATKREITDMFHKKSDGMWVFSCVTVMALILVAGFDGQRFSSTTYISTRCDLGTSQKLFSLCHAP